MIETSTMPGDEGRQSPYSALANVWWAAPVSIIFYGTFFWALVKIFG